MKFKNERLNDMFLKDGYVIVDFSELNVLYNRFHKKFCEGIFTSMSLTNSALEKEICHTIWEIFLPHIKLFLTGYSEVKCAAFVSKSPESNSEIMPHQDPSYVDEENGFSLNIWAPHCNVDGTNGALFVVKKSNRLLHLYALVTQRHFIDTNTLKITFGIIWKWCR